MSETNYTRIDFIIIIAISLLVSFIIGFNIIQLIDNKLNSIVINVPPSNCKLPPIYLNLDKNQHLFINNENEHFLSKNSDNQTNNTDNQTNNTDTENIKTYEEFTTSSDYNDLNKIPLLVNSTPSNPNQNLNQNLNLNKSKNDKLKLINNSNSPLSKLEKLNKKNIMNLLQINNLSTNKIGGYNTFVDLKQDSYANLTSIGKDLFTPYSSLPISS